MFKKMIAVLSVPVGAGATLFFLYSSRPYYVARYGVPISILAELTGILLLLQNLRGNKKLLPSSLMKWLGLYYGFILITGSIFTIIYSFPYMQSVQDYRNPYITFASKYALAYDEERINRDVNSLIGKKSPECIFNLSKNNSEHRLSDYYGKVIILNFWATWCFPCVSELLSLDTLLSQYKSDLEVLALSYEKPDTIKSFLKLQAHNVTIGYCDWDVVPVMPYYALPIIPQTFIIDRNGILKEWFTGKRNHDEFEKIIKHYL